MTANTATTRQAHAKAFRTALTNNGVAPNTRGDFTYQVQYACYHHEYTYRHPKGRLKTNKINFYTDNIELADKIAADFRALKPRNRDNARGHVTVAKREGKTNFTDNFRR